MMSLSAVWQAKRDSLTGEVEAECHSTATPAAVSIHETTVLTSWDLNDLPARKVFRAELLHKYVT